MSKTYYSGPGKIYYNSVGLQAEGENGQIVAIYVVRNPDKLAHIGIGA